MPKAEAERRFAEMGEPLKCELIEDKAGETVSCYEIEGTLVYRLLPWATRPGDRQNQSLQAALDRRRALARRRFCAADAAHLRDGLLLAEELDERLKQREEAERRDHRRLGPELDLFSFSEVVGPGLVLWHPNGALIRKVIEQFLNDELYRRGYSFVNTPHITQSELFHPATSITTRAASTRRCSTRRTRAWSTGSSR